MKDDKSIVSDLLDQVSIDRRHLIRVFRLKSKKGIAPVIVELRNKETRNDFIKKSYRKFKDIYVNPDLTDAQRNSETNVENIL